VLHVHDLVDFVSQEAAQAGKNAASYIASGEKKAERLVKINPVDGVRYTVPEFVRPEDMEDTLTVRFRVGAVYKNSAVCTYFGDKCVARRKKQIFAPGEMEQVILKKSDLLADTDLKEITIRIEEA
ncbi:MAG TPA: pyridine nucleotide-disulfide oxidoreductase, partial [Lachnospiraceae bacterium]|nr:pyridine nucleotide-disulfide oxidoreductase [Lachnospiraceae bacterium]